MIELLVLDVDGCMTNGQITYSNFGDEIKSFDVKDGLAISSWIKLGKKAAIITGRNSKIVSRRANELGITYLYQGVDNKEAQLRDILKKENLEFDQVSAVGDDLNDNKMLSLVGWSFAPNNATKHTKSIVDTVLHKNGGDGAIREMIDMIIERENLTEDFLKLWL
ncbi:MAG: HAD hydrolase family protein [Sulfurospirillaceae bacterium]|nr:HAD hydrolase family protein [Sulfurospirillaceae bacterium]